MGGPLALRLVSAPGLGSQDVKTTRVSVVDLREAVGNVAANRHDPARLNRKFNTCFDLQKSCFNKLPETLHVIPDAPQSGDPESSNTTPG
jgi:hypothetical protein